MKVVTLFLFAICLRTVQSKKYQIFRIQKLNWFAAFQDCQSRGLQLATINSQAEQNDLEIAVRNADVPDHLLWTSGTDLAEEGNFVWMSTGQSVSYSKWSSPQPDNQRGIEHCVHIWDHDGLTWNDDDCTRKLYYICEQKGDSVHISADVFL